eukprot:scaffold1723_cov104-Isochrysis_galbana.AAC.3
MRSASLDGGRARCGCRSVRGNIGHRLGVGTSPSAGPRALQPGGQRARVMLRRALLLGFRAAGHITRSAAGLPPSAGWPGRSRWRCSIGR